MSEPSPTPVLLVRHGEVAVEHRGCFYGGAEVPLSPEGARDSLTLADTLSRRAPPPGLVASSPLSRARAVAEPLAAALGLRVQVHEGLRELDRGEWTHLQAREVEARQPGAIARYLIDPEAGAAPGGETESQFAARVWAALDELIERAAGRPAVVVCHGHVIRVAMRRLLGWDARSSLERFVPYHAVVETLMHPGGAGELLAAPDGVVPEALRGSP